MQTTRAIAFIFMTVIASGLAAEEPAPERDTLVIIGEVVFFIEAGLLLGESCHGSLTVPLYDVLYIDQVFRDKASVSYLEVVGLMRELPENPMDQELQNSVAAMMDAYGCSDELADFWYDQVENQLYPTVRQLESFPNAQ